MSYSFVKVTNFYNEYLKDYYRRNPDIAINSYAEQLGHIMGEGYGWADFFATHLRSFGVDAHEIVGNALPLQQAWARERGIKASGKDIVMAQLKALQPDVVFIQDSIKFNGAWINSLREEVPSIKQLIGWIGGPFTEDYLAQFRAFDFMLTCHPGWVEDFTKQGMPTHLFHHAFEGSLLPKIICQNATSAIDCIFIGSIYPGEGFYSTRMQMLESIKESNIGLSIYGYLLKVNPFKVLMKKVTYLAANTLKAGGLSGVARHLPALRTAVHWTQSPQVPRYSETLKSAVKPPVYGMEMLQALSRAKIGLNFHVNAAGKYAGNMRLYEVTGVGSCLLTDWKENLHELFEVDREVVTYKTAEECLEKVKWLLDHPKEREEIAKAGQARTLRDHTYEKRALQLNNLITAEFKK